MSNNSLSLYVHIPFCVNKCSYCSFSVAIGALARADEYIEMLSLERASDGVEISSLYIGGGTPSCLSSAQMQRLFDTIRRRFTIAAGAEITVEANPDSVDEDKCCVWREAGVTRLSLGVQSLNDATLLRLGRPHRADDARRALSMLRAHGFSNLNVDLIMALPWQTHDEALGEVQEVLSLGSEHISLYALNVEEKSAFFVKGVKVDEEAQARLYQEVCAHAHAKGYTQYEVSNFAKPGCESRHNIHYWDGGDYVGLGMSAHSHIDGERFWNASALAQYIAAIRERGDARVGAERLAPSEKLMEVFLFALRMNRGADVNALEQRFGIEMSPDRKEMLESFIEMGLLEEAGQFIRATPRGRLLLDEISARLV